MKKPIIVTIGLISMFLVAVTQASSATVIEAHYLYDDFGRNFAYHTCQHSWTLDLTIQSPYNTTQPTNITVLLVHTLYQIKGLTMFPYQQISMTFTLSIDEVDPSVTPYPISVEVEFPDETFTWTMNFYVRWPGDANGDGHVGSWDLILLAKTYGSDPGEPDWNTNCDFDGDGHVGSWDLIIMAKNYGKGIV